ncbi:MAG: TIGR03086 family protein [Chloroflexia bacterium]|nr:TIGR03086 family protein [Chloroflexia bacterium]
MNEPAVFILAEHALLRVINQIGDEQWAMVMPPEFSVVEPGRTVTLREVVASHAYDDAWVPDMLTGRTMDEVGMAKFDGDLLGEQPKESFTRIVEAACAAAGALDDLDRTVHCSFGDYTAREYLEQITSFRGLRAYDIAEVVGVESRLSPDLVQGLWDEIYPQAEAWRAAGFLGPLVEVPEDADLHDRLLGLTGRQP